MSEPSLPPQSAPAKAAGRPADLLAALLAALGTILSVLAAIWFFAGFAENDTRPEHLASALFLTLGLFAFAIGPFCLVTLLARRAYRRGGRMRDYLWTLLLMIPWIILGSLSLTHTPLPKWTGLLAMALSGCLALWALVSLILDWRSGNQMHTQALSDVEET